MCLFVYRSLAESAADKTSLFAVRRAFYVCNVMYLIMSHVMF